MSPVHKALLHIGVLWFHVGIGPMIGMGPMDARRKPRTRSGTRKVAEQQRQPVADGAIVAYPTNRRADAVAERANAA
jgi:hypothetical protein